MTAHCNNCGTDWLFEDEDIIILLPFPHWDCPRCGSWIAAFQKRTTGLKIIAERLNKIS